MGLPFKRRRRGGIEVRLPSDERAVLVRLLADVSTLLDDTPLDDERDGAEPDPLTELVGFELGKDVPPPEDPAVARLLPDGSADDAEAAEEFRRLTEHGLRRRKRSSLAVAVAALERADEPLTLADGEALALLKGLTDVRLVLAERLGVQTDEDATSLHDALRDAGDSQEPWVIHAALYDVLTWWQEALVEALH
jgi:hypothetical protein